MSRYFNVSTGLRGCYMADSSYEIRVDTRRELRAVIASELDSYRDAGFLGATDRAAGTLAAAAWRESRKPCPSYLPYCAPVADGLGADYCQGVFVVSSTRADWLAYEGESA